MYHKIVLALFLLAGWISAAAAVSVTGIVADESGETLPQATVRLLAAKDSSYVKGGASDAAGRFTIRDVRRGRYIVEASYIGYNPTYVNINVDQKNIDLATIRLGESSVMLAEVKVVGVKTAVKVMEDTVEFNADSYKTAPNSVVEDLLKKLPGVEVGSDGKITANGKEVTKILVDGKEFFSDDPTVASKNLPVDMVDKLQVVDRKSDLARMTGVDDGEDETVINLTVKRGMNNGWFGNVEAGYGTDSRYIGSFNINRFWNGNQLTLLGNANNINELGFTDGNGQRFRRFGGNNGITASQALGVNFNVGNQEIFRVGGNVMWSRTSRDTRQNQERTYLFTDSTAYASIGKRTLDRGQNLRADFRIQWKPDEYNSLDIAPRISYNHNHSMSTDSTITRAGDAMRSMVSNSFNTGDSRGDSWEYGLRLIYNHQFRNHRGRSFSIMANYSHSDIREDDNSYSRNIFYLFNDSTDIYDQRADNHTWNNSLRTRLSWTEPLGDPAKGNFLTVAYGVNGNWNNADKLVYDRILLPPLPEPDPALLSAIYSYAAMTATSPNDVMALDAAASEVLNSDLSNRFRNDFLSQDVRVGYKHVSKSTTLDVGLSVVPTMSKSTNLINDAKSIPTRWVTNFAPFLRYRYKISKSSSLQMNYNGRSSQPSMTQLQPVPDMSDPLRVVIGNPLLDPSFTHNIRLRYQDFNSESQRSLMLMGFFSLVQNSIVSRTEFNNETGGQTTTYENVNGVWNGRIMNMFSMPLRNKMWQISNHAFLSASHNVGFNNGARNNSTTMMFNEMPSISFRPDNFDFTLRGRYSLQHTRNSLQSVSAAGMTVHSYGGSFDAIYNSPIGIVLNSELTYSATSGYASGFNTNEWMWNASIAYQFLRDRSATITLKAYDLLQQRSNVSRSVTANYIDDIRYNSLTRYFMLTFSYRFNTFGKGNEPKSRGMGPGGPGGPGRPPRF